MKENNRAFLEMRGVARGWLAGRDPRDIANRTGFAFDPERSEFALTTLGREVRLHWPDCEIEGGIAEWHELLLLHYMHLADGSALPQEEWIAFAELRDGMVRGGGFDRDSAERLSALLGERAPGEVERACRALGGETVESNADYAAMFPLFARLPVMLKLWFADDEFPASAKLLLAKGTDHCLTVEDAVTAGEVLLLELEREIRKLCAEGPAAAPRS